MPQHFDFDCLVVGAGVVGLAIARELVSRGMSTLVLERNSHFGEETSSRNSEVIHAGIYYPRNSLKARLCVSGRDAMYAFADRHDVPFRRCGKLIVARDDSQVAELEALQARATANGVPGLRMLDKAELNAKEPELSGAAALFSPITGIIDSHALMLALVGEAESCGAQIVYRTNVTGFAYRDGGWNISISGEDSPILRVASVVNSAGLAAPMLADTIEGYTRPAWLKPRYAKGSYFSHSGPVPFSHLIYPMPELGGLGVHLTLDLQGQARFGPDVEWVSEPDYDVSYTAIDRFYEGVRQFWPKVERARLLPGYAGIRPKIVGPGEPPADFIIEGPRDHGRESLINLYGIESPGLTASLAIAEHVVDMLA